MKKGIVPAFATQIRGLSGCAHSMRSTLNPPTITFSTQKSSRVANTLQPKSNTPASGTRFAATSTRALGDRRRPAAAADGVGVRWGIVTVGNDAGSTRRRQGLAGPAAPGDLARVSNVSNNLAVVGLSGSLGATVVASGVYGTSAQFQDGKTAPELLKAVDRAVEEALALAGAAQH